MCSYIHLLSSTDTYGNDKYLKAQGILNELMTYSSRTCYP